MTNSTAKEAVRPVNAACSQRHFVGQPAANGEPSMFVRSSAETDILADQG
jgi:hypothetical protein